MGDLLQDLLRASAGRFPERTAVQDGATGTSYAELDALSNRVARALLREGVRPGDRVAIYVRKSLASVAAIFGVLKAGGVYVPLDPGSPPQRLAYIAGDCGVNVICTEAAKVRAAERLGATPLVVDGASFGTSAEPPPDPGVCAGDLAYILYTSGSTGAPKGVMISHRAGRTFVDWACRTFRMTAEDRVTSHAPIHFDLSTFDVFATIKASAAIVLVPEASALFPVQLVELLEQQRISVTYLVPSVMSLVRAYGDLSRRRLETLRCLLFAGEVCPIHCLRDWARAVPNAELYNLYGPTETNVCTFYRVRPEDLHPDRDRPVPIGAACENTAVFAVDEQGRRIETPGVRGELWVRGPGLADGYWGDPARTAERFVADPFHADRREVAYRTGDDVMLDEAGTDWIYLGRRDQMVKSRGHRIELGEIETALNAHPSVEQGIVVAVPDDLLGSRLRAFCTPAPGGRPSADELHGHCRERLPDYMIPESFELLEAIPRTSTGKVDRLSLAARAARNEG